MNTLVEKIAAVTLALATIVVVSTALAAVSPPAPAETVPSACAQ